jgi:hypothetical protein
MAAPLLFTQVFAVAVKHGDMQVLGAPFLLSAALLVCAIVLSSRVLPRPPGA